jgi:hypothetical protein
MSTHMKFVPLNVRGMMSTQARSRVFHFLCTLNVDVIFLQETHTPEYNACFWSQHGLSQPFGSLCWHPRFSLLHHLFQAVFYKQKSEFGTIPLVW